MQFETCLLPCAHSQLHEAPFYNLHSYDVFVSLSYDLIRLQQEKDVLSKGLANCVMYLKALRKKQANHACQLNTVPSASQKKRKKMQHTRRHLDNEIKNRERDEEAFLDNLQICETNIFLTNMKAYYASFYANDLTSTSTLYAPTLCSYSRSETTYLNWNGWTDEAVVSSFQKRTSNHFFVDDVAPDACSEDYRHDSVVIKDAKRPSPLSGDAVELPNWLPVPPNTAQLHITRPSMLSAAATVFQPTLGKAGGCSETKLNRLNISSSTATGCVGLLQKRRLTAADILPSLQRFSIDARPKQEHLADETGRNTTPQPSLQKATRPQMNRQRRNSL